MAGRKRKPKKGAKKRAKRGAKKGARRRSGTAKRGASRTTLRAGLVVTGKPNKRTLKAHCLKAKHVGKTSAGKTVYKIESNKKCKVKKTAASNARKFARAEVIAAGKKPTKKAIDAMLRERRKASRLPRGPSAAGAVPDLSGLKFGG